MFRASQLIAWVLDTADSALCLQKCSSTCRSRICLVPCAVLCHAKHISHRGWASLQVVNDVTSAIILPIDVEDMDDSYHFIADVPGLEKGDIKARPRQSNISIIIIAFCKLVIAFILNWLIQSGPALAPDLQDKSPDEQNGNEHLQIMCLLLRTDPREPGGTAADHQRGTPPSGGRGRQEPPPQRAPLWQV